MKYPPPLLLTKIMHMRNALLLLFLFATCQNFAQTSNTITTDSLKTRYENETLHFYKGYISRGMNGQRLRGMDLKTELNKTPEAGKEFALYQKKKTASLIIAGAGLASVIAGAIIRNNTPKSQGAAALLIFGYSTQLVALPIAIGARKKLDHAIWLHNRDILFPVKY